MKCQSLFSGKNKKNIINLLSAEFAQRVIKVKLSLPFHLCFYSLFQQLSQFLKLSQFILSNSEV